MDFRTTKVPTVRYSSALALCVSVFLLDITVMWHKLGLRLITVPWFTSVWLVKDLLAQALHARTSALIFCSSGLEMENNQLSKESTNRSDLVSDDGKNSKSVVCQRCGSKVLCPGMAVFAEKEVWCMAWGSGLVSMGFWDTTVSS